MAASVDLTSGGTGGPADLDALVKALDRFTAALQGVAKQAGLGGGDEAAPAGETPGAPAGGMGGISQMFSSLIPKQLQGLTGLAQNLGGFGEKLAGMASQMQLAGNAAKGIPGVSAGITALVGRFGTSLVGLARPLLAVLGPAGIAAGIVMLAKKIPVVGEAMEVGAQGFLRPLRGLGASISASLVPMRQFQERALVVASTFENLGKSQYAYSEAIGNSSNQVASVVKGGLSRVTAVLTNPLQEIPQLVAELRPFVEAFNPAVLQEYDQAMRSVMAVIGEALVPVIRVASALLREFAGYLRPIMRQLEPIIGEVANTVGNFLKEIMPLLPEFIQTLIPVLKKFADELKNNIAASVAYEKGQFSLLDKARWVIADWTGWIEKPKFETSARMPAGVQKENISAYGAAQAPTFKGTAELGKDLMQAAFIARPGELVDDSAKQTADNTARAADLLEQLVDVNKGAQTYDARVNSSWAENPISGFGQWAMGQAVEGVYNFGVGATNLLSGNSLTEGMVDI